MEKIITINPYSMTSYYVDVFFNDIKLSNATCFFTKIKDAYYLVTNWHIVSGRNADTKECLNKMGSVPNKLRVYVPKEDDNSTISYKSVVPLCNTIMACDIIKAAVKDLYMQIEVLSSHVNIDKKARSVIDAYLNKDKNALSKIFKAPEPSSDDFLTDTDLPFN